MNIQKSLRVAVTQVMNIKEIFPYWAIITISVVVIMVYNRTSKFFFSWKKIWSLPLAELKAEQNPFPSLDLFFLSALFSFHPSPPLPYHISF